MGRRQLLAAGMLALLLAGCSSAPSGSPATSSSSRPNSSGAGSPGTSAISATAASALVSKALAAGKRESSLHYVSESKLMTTSYTEVITVVGTVNNSGGWQLITQELNGEVGHITVELLDGTAYFKGDAGGLERYMGLSSSAASAHANHWISVTTSDGGAYTQASAALTVSSALSNVEISPPFESTADINRAEDIEIWGRIGKLPSGYTSQQAVITIADRGHGLPLSYRASTATSSERITTSFTCSAWGAPVKLPATPATAVPYKSLAG